MDKPVILYHGGCPDGFGGAYAAWRKFGDEAEYVPLFRDAEPPMGFAGRHLYFIDFTYPQDIMDRYLKEAGSVTVLDHHKGVEDVVLKMPEYRFALDHSGAVIAWQYFHPNTEVPLLLQYIEQGDLYTTNLPNTEEILSYVYTRPMEFAEWDTLSAQLEDSAERERITERGGHYAEHKRVIVEQIMDLAELVKFEGYTCYLASCSPIFKSPVGAGLARKMPPLALVANVRPWGVRVSMRSNGDADVAKIAQKYGGNGHPNAAAFSLPWGTPIPWEPVNDYAHPGS